jgi:hypothetical protein
MKILESEMEGFEAVKMLRQNKLSQGNPFMINSLHLPEGQCYLEFPDGSIKLVTVKENDFFVLANLTKTESRNLRKKYGFV